MSHTAHTLHTLRFFTTDIAGCIHQSARILVCLLFACVCVCVSTSVGKGKGPNGVCSYLYRYLRVMGEVAEERHVVVWIKCISVST